MKKNDAALAAGETPKDEPTSWRVDDVLWAERRPLLVVDKPRKKPGRPRKKPGRPRKKPGRSSTG